MASRSAQKQVILQHLHLQRLVEETTVVEVKKWTTWRPGHKTKRQLSLRVTLLYVINPLLDPC